MTPRPLRPPERPVRRTLALAFVVGLALAPLGIALASAPALGTDPTTEDAHHPRQAAASLDVPGYRRDGARSSPFAQAGNGNESDDDAHTISLSSSAEAVRYTVIAPGLAPTDDVDLATDDEDDADQEVIHGDAAFGLIGNDRYDTYRFTGSVRQVQLRSNDTGALTVRIDGKRVDPRTLTGNSTTESASTTPATESTAPTTSTSNADAATSTRDPAASTGTGSTAAGTGDESGFSIAMYLLIGVVSGLALAGGLAFVIRSDRRN